MAVFFSFSIAGLQVRYTHPSNFQEGQDGEIGDKHETRDRVGITILIVVNPR